LRLGKKLLWAAVLLVVLAGLGFLARPVSYFNESMYLRNRLTGVQNHNVMVGGHRVHYETEGPDGGRAVVLVHGLGGQAEDWRELAPYLAKAGFRVYLPDLVGYGRSDKPGDFSYSLHDEADVVTGFLYALDLKQVDLGGWSMGGAIAQHVAAAHPERIKRLLLFDSAGLFILPAWDTRLFTPNSPAELNQMNLRLTPNARPVSGFIARDILRVSDERAWIIHRAIATMLTGQDATDKLLPQLKMPVLIVWGAEDKITPLSQGRTMHALVPQSELDVIPGCGHLAPRQCATQIGPKVVEFEKQ